jgi:uncharacterized phiE125 gp8 family phage protein
MPGLIDDAAVADVKAYLRLAGDEEDALLARLLRVAAELCERFTGLALLLCEREAVLGTSSPEWQRLPAAPVSAITAVATLDPTGGAAALPVAGYAIDIDAGGTGWVRLAAPVGARRMRVTYVAGLAADWASLPDPLRQGVVRAVAHVHAHRDAPDDLGPPPGVAALWRPFRRMRLT